MKLALLILVIYSLYKASKGAFLGSVSASTFLSKLLSALKGIF